MKKITSKILFIIIITIFSIALFSCIKNEDDKLYLVKQTMTDKSGTLTVINYYNEDYQIVKQDNISGGESDTISELKYDDNGYLSYQKSTSKSGLITETFIKNDNNGNPLEYKFSQTYNGKTTEFTWMLEYTDENGSYVQTTSNGTVWTIKKDSYGNEISRSDNNGQSATIENKYENGLLVEAKTTQTTGKKTAVTTAKYEYDKSGNKIKVTYYDSDGNSTGNETFEYSSTVEFAD